MRASHVRTGLLLLCMLLTVLFIFSNSLENGGSSNAQSGSVSDFLGKLFHLPPEVYEGDLFRGLVRSLAHMAEFALLGAEAALLIWNIRFSWASVAFGGLGCFLVALIDEVIQFFVPGRASELSDVFLDTLGVLCGMALVLLLRWMTNALKKKRSRENRLV